MQGKEEKYLKQNYSKMITVLIKNSTIMFVKRRHLHDTDFQFS